MPLADRDVSRILAVLAHPDDVDYAAAGTVAVWTGAGIEVTYLLCTRGEQGGFDDLPRDQVPALREAEQRAAAAAVGVSDVRFLEGYRDGYLEVAHDLVRDITRVIRQVRPQRVLIQSAERWYERIHASHPDHLVLGEATIRAVYPAARNAHAYPELLADEGLEPWTVAEAWLMSDQRADHVVDVTATFDHKVAALRAHASQTAHRGEELVTALHGWLGGIAQGAGLGEGRLAEEFRVVPTA